MFGFSKKPAPKRTFDRKVLRKNDISLLIVDERWNNLFTNTEKTSEIVGCEASIRELLKEQSRILEESRNIAQRKKKYLDEIIQLTPEAFDKQDEKAKNRIKECEKEVKLSNERMEKIEEELYDIPEKIKEVNLELLEHTVNLVYFKMLYEQKRVKELEVLIEETREKLKQYIEEKEILAKDDTDTYSYFHDLLGAEELEKLDGLFFNDIKPTK